MFYGAMVWDPWLIVSQIVCLQCLYYLTLGVLMSLLVGTRVPRLTLLYLFDFATLTPRTPTGWCVIASFLLTAVAGYARRSFCYLPFLFFVFASPSWLVQSSDRKHTV
jgi:protein SYS1